MAFLPKHGLVGLFGVIMALTLSPACSPKAEKKPAESQAAAVEGETQLPPQDEPADINGVTITLADCAGAAAAMAGLSPIKQAEPKGDSADENFYWVLLALMDKDPGFEGGAGRLAAETAMTAWEEKPENDTRTYLAACQARYVSQ